MLSILQPLHDYIPVVIIQESDFGFEWLNDFNPKISRMTLTIQKWFNRAEQEAQVSIQALRFNRGTLRVMC